MSLHLGKIQPGTVATSDPLWIGSTLPRTVAATATIMGDNFSPIDTELSIVLEVERAWLEDAEEEYDKRAEVRDEDA